MYAVLFTVNDVFLTCKQPLFRYRYFLSYIVSATSGLVRNGRFLYGASRIRSSSDL
jgi:hypothetical protein